MADVPDDLARTLDGEEHEHLEFKEAQTSFSFDKLARYMVALANEGGGRLVLGVTDDRSRRVVGTAAFADLNQIKLDLLTRLHFRVDVHELSHQGRRILMFEAPPRPLGVPRHDGGQYWMRSGSSLVAMSPDELHRIFAEGQPDFSALVCGHATVDDLDRGAIERLRHTWADKRRNDRIRTLSDEQLLADLRLADDNGVTHAALILLGTGRALDRLLPQAELVFEYRANNRPGPAQDRRTYRLGFFLYFNDLWQAVNLRNDLQHYQEGLFVHDVPTFNERVIREAILNAIAHRDYRQPGSVFVRQYPRFIRVESPGGFPPGVDATNILDLQVPRNRLVAETLEKAGFVERSGQGVDIMYEESIREGKGKPDFSRSDASTVHLVLQGQVADPAFVRFLERAATEKQTHFDTRHLILLNALAHGQGAPEELHGEREQLLDHLRSAGVIERVGRGRGTRYILSRSLYAELGQRGVYTRTRGLDHEYRKGLLLQHIRENEAEGSRFFELAQVLPDLTRNQLRGLLRELREEGRIRVLGRTRAARWFPADSSSTLEQSLQIGRGSNADK